MESPPSTRFSASFVAASAYDFRTPGLEPQKTQTRFMVGQGFSHFNARAMTKKIDLNFLLFQIVPGNDVQIVQRAVVLSW